MDIKDFKSGTYRDQYQYKSFVPNKVNQLWTWGEPSVNTLLEEATLRLGELNAFSLYVPDVEIFIRMHVYTEATKSSRIEGTKTDVEEALLKEDEVQEEKKDDWTEVQNYAIAMNNAVETLAKIPLSTRLLKDTHSRLMQGARGENKMPGEYRTSQNWIGGTSVNDAVFVPPHHTEISDMMNDLESFLHNEEIKVPYLIRIAIAHYQFETIHPFLDGNGRIGRLLITLYLVSQGFLAKPTLYLSDYFEKHKSVYYDNLTFVRTNNNLTQWIKFFLVAVIETSKKGITTFREILKLKEEIESEKIVTLGKKLPKARLLMNTLYRTPYIRSTDVETSLDITAATANALIQDFVSLGILREVTGQKRNRLFLFLDYLKLFSDPK